MWLSSLMATEIGLQVNYNKTFFVTDLQDIIEINNRLLY